MPYKTLIWWAVPTLRSILKIKQESYILGLFLHYLVIYSQNIHLNILT
ncbi:hypothetical protein CAL7102_03374 [Dulcicalothrix desertica PCC 7102]|nr:hypothetical protein CAL7102_03374 [Dulcicalothrix desertica PCC 7102]